MKIVVATACCFDLFVRKSLELPLTLTTNNRFLCENLKANMERSTGDGKTKKRKAFFTSK